MSDAPTSAEPVEIPDEMRDAAKQLGWEDGLLEIAVTKASLAEINQALKGGITGEQAKAFLGGESILQPDFSWMEVPTQWGIKAKASDPAMGLTIEDLMIDTYGDVPDVWHNRSEIARGSYPNAIVEDMGYTIFDKATVWSDNCVPLYEEAIRDRWAPATDLNWRSLEPLSEDMERAVCQFLTEQADRAYQQGALLSGWLPEISYGYLELKLFLSTIIYDVAKQAEAFRKRALSNGGGLGLQAPTDYMRAAKEARSYPELIAILFVQDSMLLTLFEHGDDFAQNQVERDLYALVAKDRRRVMDYQIERLRSFLFKMPDRREEQNLYFGKAEGRMFRDWMDSAVNEPLAIMLGGGRENIETGLEKLQVLRAAQINGYLNHLKEATFFRGGGLNPRMQEILAAVEGEPAEA